MAQRLPEFGVRRALGATAVDLASAVLTESGQAALTGVAAGTALAAIMARAIRPAVYGVPAADALTFLGVPVGVLALSIAASLRPAWHAARADPLRALHRDR